MKNSFIFKVFQIICFGLCILDCNGQDSIFSIPLKFSEPQPGCNNINLSAIQKITNSTDFVVPQVQSEYLVGYVKINPYQHYYDDRNSSPSMRNKYLKWVKKNNIDTSQFVLNYLSSNKIYIYVSLYNKIKTVIIDTDSDSSFCDETVFEYDMREGTTTNAENLKIINTDIGIPVDSSGILVRKKINISILVNYYDEADKGGFNDSLQCSIFPNLTGNGYFLLPDTVSFSLYCQNFNQFYQNDKLNGVFWISNPDLHYKRTVLKYGREFQIGHNKYSLLKYNPHNQLLFFKVRKVDSIGITPGNYFPKSAGLDTLNGLSVVFFTGSWCVPCKAVLDSLLILHKLRPDIKIYSINKEYDTTEFLNYLNINRIDWPVIYDGKTTDKTFYYFAKYEITGVPELFLLNSQRRILRKETNRGDCIDLIEELKKGTFDGL